MEQKITDEYVTKMIDIYSKKNYNEFSVDELEKLKACIINSLKKNNADQE